MIKEEALREAMPMLIRNGAFGDVCVHATIIGDSGGHSILFAGQDMMVTGAEACLAGHLRQV
jgi:hypothetical protein